MSEARNQDVPAEPRDAVEQQTGIAEAEMGAEMAGGVEEGGSEEGERQWTVEWMRGGGGQLWRRQSFWRRIR